ncbi:hypothetical protein PHSY_000506 [Pseudozyma hubeiensis SY62]|uniref:Uncharacterized protein n=1 Tax=Pseudozyma hubeiensis (strain SY62) TaxID=1305764 RepID=R9NWQ2_PSEHS|nr:hypothetical protein PHSY_000506 [Pseudozyma hubeiensis SY62]GAC92946.1 hypothetical protein PHSY_000506 [Pseudozyma hubeiensis SY62]
MPLLVVRVALANQNRAISKDPHRRWSAFSRCLQTQASIPPCLRTVGFDSPAVINRDRVRSVASLTLVANGMAHTGLAILRSSCNSCKHIALTLLDRASGRLDVHVQCLAAPLVIGYTADRVWRHIVLPFARCPRRRNECLLAPSSERRGLATSAHLPELLSPLLLEQRSCRQGPLNRPAAEKEKPPIRQFWVSSFFRLCFSSR